MCVGGCFCIWKVSKYGLRIKCDYDILWNIIIIKCWNWLLREVRKFLNGKSRWKEFNLVFVASDMVSPVRNRTIITFATLCNRLCLNWTDYRLIDYTCFGLIQSFAKNLLLCGKIMEIPFRTNIKTDKRSQLIVE